MRFKVLLASLAISLSLGAAPTIAQTSATRATLQTQNNSTIAPNGVGAITGSVMNAMLGNIIASEATLQDFNIFANAPIYGQTGIPFSVAGNPLVFSQCTGVIQGNGASPPTCLGSSAFPLAPGGTLISPSTNGGVLFDNAGVLSESTTLPSGTSLSGSVGLPLNSGVSGQLPLANGGTSASLTASNGGIVYSGAASLAVLAGTGTANQCLLSGSNSAPTWGACAPATGVSSFNSRTGAVSPASGDYLTTQLTTSTSGSAPSAGSLGEVISNSGTSTAASNSVGTPTSVSLTAGDWRCGAYFDFSFSGATSFTGNKIGIGTTTGVIPASPAGRVQSFPAETLAPQAYSYDLSPNILFHFSTTTTVFATSEFTGGISGPSVTANLICVRND